MHYQWHPNHVEWGNISWGHATSKDLITWIDVDHHPNDGIQAWSGSQAESLATSKLTSDHHIPAKYNSLGIFSGTAQSVNIRGEVDGTLLAFYTSVARLPFSWDGTYVAGSESQSLAYSNDGGTTWVEYEHNPVISNPPSGWNVTGFRDPFYHDSPELDTLLKYTEPHYYTIFGSDVGGAGPRIPLYSAPASDLTRWTFLGSLWEPPGNSTIGPIHEVGTWGWLFEVPNLFSLDGHWFVSACVQGGTSGYSEKDFPSWSEGLISARTNGSVAFEPTSKGVVDWGLLYAVTAFNDMKNHRRIQYGWVPEDMNTFGIVQQGYQGALSIPRDLFVKTTPNVIPPSPLYNSSSIYTVQHNGTYSARTLGARPVPEVMNGLRTGSKHSTHTIHNLTGCGNSNMSQSLFTGTDSSYELTFTICSTTGLTGLNIAASPKFEEYTSIYFDPARSTITVDRSHSSLIKEFSHGSHTGFFAPYNISPSPTFTKASPKPEPLTFTIILDGSLLEIFVNDRFSLTSRIYPSRGDSLGIGLFAAPGVEVTYAGDVQIWQGLMNVWPARPRNSSSVLVYDDDVQTNNRNWWSGR